MMSRNRNTTQFSSLKNYDLFRLVKVLEIKTLAQQTKVETRARKKNVDEVASSVTISCVASCGVLGHSFIALYCSNDYFIFRYVGESGIPQVRQLAWFQEPNKRVVAMTFNPSFQWLMCATVDLTVVLIPIYFLMCRSPSVDPQKSNGEVSNAPPHHVGWKKEIPGLLKLDNLLSQIQTFATNNNISRAFGNIPDQFRQSKNTTKKLKLDSLTDITTILTSSKSKHAAVSACVWWRTWARSYGPKDYGIISSLSGLLTFINITTQKEFVVRLPDGINKMDLVVDPEQTLKYLLLRTASSGYWQLILEQKTENNIEAINMHNRDRPPFIPAPIERIPPGASVSIQQTKQGTHLGVWNPATARFEVYDPGFRQRFPLFSYQLSSSMRLIHLTDKLLFAVSRGEHKKDRITVISNLYAVASGQNQFRKDGVMQEFEIPEGQNVRGIFRAFEHWPESSPNTNISVESDSSNRKSRRLSKSLAHPLHVHQNKLDFFLLWTQDAVYECRPSQNPEVIFYKLLAMGLEKTHAESLGKTLGLDLLAMYEAAADVFFDMGQYGRALSLYYLSNVRTSKLMSKFLNINRMDIVMTHLREALHQPTALSPPERKRLSNILFRCHLQRFLAADAESKSQLENEFMEFLKKNEDYDAKNAMRSLLKQGFVHLIQVITETKSLYKEAFHLLDSPSTAAFVDTNSLLQFSTQLTNGKGSNLFRSLPPNQKAEILLSELESQPIPTPEFVQLLDELLPALDEKALVNVALAFDPQGETMGRVLNVESSPLVPTLRSRNFKKSTELWENLKRSVLDLFITSLLCLSHLRILPGGDSFNIMSQIREIKHQKRERTKSDIRRSAMELKIPKNEEETKKKQQRPLSTPLMLSRKVTSVACGWTHVCAIADNGEIYSWGRNAFGELGYSKEQNYVSEMNTTRVSFSLLPRRIDSLKGKRITNVACGGEHSFAVWENGQGVFSWGCSQFGQLGHGDMESCSLPRRLETLPSNKKITQISCGYHFTALMSDEGEVYTCGCGENGELGVEPKLPFSTNPVKVDLPERGRQISAGYMHVALLTERGNVYTWGNGQYGQLGHGIKKDLYSPKLVESLHDKCIKNIASGSFHTIVVTDLGNLYSWGRGSKYRLGHDTADDEFAPKLIDGMMLAQISKVACGFWHTVALAKAGSLFVWGSGKFGQLGNGGTGDQLPAATVIMPNDDPNITFVQISCGEQFSAAISDSGKLYMWGNGEFGQLGLGDCTGRLQPTNVRLDSSGSVSYKNLSQVFGTDLNSRKTFTTAFSFNQSQPNFASSAPSTIVNNLSHLNRNQQTPSNLGQIEPYGQDHLEKILRDNFQSYNQTKILCRALDWNNWRAASVIYSLLGHWNEAVEHLLWNIYQNHWKINRNAEIVVEQTFALISSYIIKPTELKERARLLRQFLSFWAFLCLAIEPLEQFMLHNISTIAPILGYVLTNPCPDTTRWSTLNNNKRIIQFSPKLYMTALKQISEQLRQEKANILSSVPQKKIWSHIKDNLEKHLDKRDVITISNLSKPNIISNPLLSSRASMYLSAPLQKSMSKEGNEITSSELNDTIVFSCGHNFVKKTFYSFFLPMFEQKMSELQLPMPATSKLMIADYHSTFINLGCPFCVYNLFRSPEQANSNSKPWAL